MNIRQKCAAAIGGSLAISALHNIAVLRILVFPSFVALENQEAASDVHRAVAAIEAKIANAGVTASDYSIGDDTYTFALQGGDAYLEENYAPASVAHLRINLVSIHDRSGKLLFDAAYQAGVEEAKPAEGLALAVIDPEALRDPTIAAAAACS